ncbi:hypothetical protein ACF068_19720 [Streptomyces sp. NPDC016309]|uniref:hypothetical protein n=1 Tax=Streptomyces sp. NPDC016309 TaxID=3364965 RepID=UPI0037022999
MKRSKGTDDEEARMPIFPVPNHSYFPGMIVTFLVVALMAHVLMRGLDKPGWMAWPIASLYLADSLRRARLAHLRLAARWNELLDDWLDHEQRLHKQQLEDLRKKHQPDQLSPE